MEKPDKKTKKLIEENTKSELELRARVKMLTSKVERQQKVLKQKENMERDIIANLKDRFEALIGEKLEK